MHLLVLDKIWKLPCYSFIIFHIQLIENFPAILDKNNEEKSKNNVNDKGNLDWIEEPHQEEGTDMEEEKLTDEEDEALSWFLFHIFNCLVHTGRSILSS